MELFDDARQGLDFIFRYGHVLSGITWIGLLYYFNFVQVPAFAELSDTARPEAIRKVAFRALWWFRYAALATLLFGLALILVKDEIGDYFESSQGLSISTGMLFGLTMFANVWMIIWPNQRIIIGSAEAVAAGGQPNPDAAAAGKKAGRASRANTFMSFTMLWFMVFTPHFAPVFPYENEGIYYIFLLVCWAFIEGSALGFIGGLDSPFNKLAFDKHQNTIQFGLAFLVIFYIVGWELIIGG